MHLYTVLLDYAGGTYTSQMTAYDEHDAFRRWTESLRVHGSVGTVSDEVAAAFAAADDQLVQLDGLVGVWCASASATKGLALINIVRTATGT
jgi:hypothetical protein